MLVNLDRWLKDGVPPPPSRYPRIADGTLVDAIALPGIPGLKAPTGPSPRPQIDFGADFDRGIVGNALPIAQQNGYRVLVPKVDADGNEVAGVRLPELAVPVATITGWNLRAQNAGAPGELCYLEGSLVAFAKTKADREANGDARLSLTERYRNPPEYAERVRNAAAALVAERFMLDEDAKRYADRATATNW